MSADRDKTPMSQLKELKDKDKVFGANLSVDEINDPKNKSNEFEFACVFKQSYNGPEFKGECNLLILPADFCVLSHFILSHFMQVLELVKLRKLQNMLHVKLF